MGGTSVFVNSGQTARGGPDPFGEIPFKLLDPEATRLIQCDGCEKWLPVHSEISLIYGGAGNGRAPKGCPFFCSTVGLKRCRGEEADIDDIDYILLTVKGL